MTYTQIAVLAAGLAVLLDVILRTRLVTRRVFWVSYAIIVFFQLISNGLLTGSGVVQYDGDVIIGSSSPETGRPAFVGDGRLAYAPVEDLLFGFAMILWSQTLWVYWGRRGVDREPHSGPPRWSRRRVAAVSDEPGRP
ncbi:MAG: lycopene cyclase domain-containing protein [Candidatus Nanopelagicales bacterium]